MQKIMFNDRYGLTQAVLEGRKTMTRRIECYDDDLECELTKEGHAICINVSHVGKSPYAIGEVVAVAQSYNDIYEELKRTHGSSSSVTRDFFHKYIQGGRMPVSNKMFVKSEAMLHKLRITDIKVERLQDISDEDCLREGVRRCDYVKPDPYYIFDEKNQEVYLWSSVPQEAFAALIGKVSGRGTWERNPWVFAYSFELIK